MRRQGPFFVQVLNIKLITEKINMIKIKYESSEKRGNSFLIAAILFGILFITTNCASEATKQKNAYLDSQYTNYVFNKSCKDVKIAIKKVLFRDGYTIESTDESSAGADNFIIESGSVTKQDPLSAQTTRYLIDGKSVEKNKCQIIATSHKKSLDKTNGQTTNNSYREHSMEYKIMSEAEPERNKKIQDEAKKIYDDQIAKEKAEKEAKKAAKS